MFIIFTPNVTLYIHTWGVVVIFKLTGLIFWVLELKVQLFFFSRKGNLAYYTLYCYYSTFYIPGLKEFTIGHKCQWALILVNR